MSKPLLVISVNRNDILRLATRQSSGLTFNVNQGGLFMKAKVIVLLHVFGLDVLLLGLFEKLLLGLSKRLAALKNAAQYSLDRCKIRNGD